MYGASSVWPTFPCCGISLHAVRNNFLSLPQTCKENPTMTTVHMDYGIPRQIAMHLMWEPSVPPSPHSYATAQWQCLTVILTEGMERQCTWSLWETKAAREKKADGKNRTRCLQLVGEQWQEQEGQEEEHCSPCLLNCLFNLLEFCFWSWCTMESSMYIQSTTV